MSGEGWAPDPTGRFTQRWFDGRDWSDQVLGANGQPTTDALERTSSGLPAPGGSGDDAPAVSSADPAPPPPATASLPAPPSAPARTDPSPMGPATAWSAPSGGAGPTSAGSLGVVGLLISGVGLLFVALSLFGLKWANTAQSSFSDIRDAFDKADFGSAPAIDQFVKAYATVLGYVLLVAVVAGLVLVAARMRSAGRATHVVVALVAAAGAVSHAVVVERLFRGSTDPEIGAWLAVVGYLAIIVGMAFAPRQAARPLS